MATEGVRGETAAARWPDKPRTAPRPPLHPPVRGTRQRARSSAPYIQRSQAASFSAAAPSSWPHHLVFRPRFAGPRK